MPDGTCQGQPDCGAVAGPPRQHPLTSAARPPRRMVPAGAVLTKLPLLGRLGSATSPPSRSCHAGQCLAGPARLCSCSWAAPAVPPRHLRVLLRWTMPAATGQTVPALLCHPGSAPSSPLLGCRAGRRLLGPARPGRCSWAAPKAPTRCRHGTAMPNSAFQGWPDHASIAGTTPHRPLAVIAKLTCWKAFPGPASQRHCSWATLVAPPCCRHKATAMNSACRGWQDCVAVVGLPRQLPLVASTELLRHMAPTGAGQTMQAYLGCPVTAPLPPAPGRRARRCLLGAARLFCRSWATLAAPPCRRLRAATWDNAFLGWPDIATLAGPLWKPALATGTGQPCQTVPVGAGQAVLL